MELKVTNEDRNIVEECEKRFSSDAFAGIYLLSIVYNNLLSCSHISADLRNQLTIGQGLDDSAIDW